MKFSLRSVLTMAPLFVLLALILAHIFGMIAPNVDLVCFEIGLVILFVVLILGPGKGGLSNTDSDVGGVDPQTWDG